MPVGDRTRKATYERDLHRCAVCGTNEGLTFQHRQAVGMGGDHLQEQPPSGSLTLCGIHNNLVEHRLRDEALIQGWKVPSKRAWPMLCPGGVPVFYRAEQQWCLLLPDWTRAPLMRGEVVRRMIESYGSEWGVWLRRWKPSRFADSLLLKAVLMVAPEVLDGGKS